MFQGITKMKVLKIALLAMALVSVPAFATGNHTCPYGGKPPKCNPKPPDPPKPSDPGQQQQQDQMQQQAANANAGAIGIGKGGNASAAGGKVSNSGNSSNRNANKNNNAAVSGSKSGANSSSGASSSSGVDTSGNSANQIDLSDRSSSSFRSNVFIPGDLPANAMNIAPGAFITTAGDTECGVLLTKIRTPIYQWDKKGKNKREAGYDEDVAPMTDRNGVQIDYQRVETGDGGYYLRGSHVTYVLATAGGSNSSQLGLQGGGGGGYGGVSYGAGTAYSQAGVRILIRPCIAARFEAKAKVQPVVRKPAAKRKPVRRAAVCIPRAAKVCPASK